MTEWLNELPREDVVAFRDALTEPTFWPFLYDKTREALIELATGQLAILSLEK